MKHYPTMLVLLAAILFAAGCGSDEGAKGPGKGNAPKGPSASAKDWDPAAGTATIEGKVVFDGQAPERLPVDMASDPECLAMHSQPALDETVVVNGNGTLKNVFVWVKEGLEDWKFPIPTEAAHLDQEGCVYVPHVLGVMAGQKLQIKNSDDVTHNIHAFAEVNESFNFSQAKKGAVDEKSFGRSELPVKIKCDIHGWMSARVFVVWHPFFAVTGDDGTFSLGKLPPGKYVLEAWHEDLGSQTMEVEVADGKTATVDFKYEE